MKNNNGHWTFSEEIGFLRYGKEEIRLEPRLSALFSILFENMNQIVPRDELISKMWPDTIVNEGSLARAVSDLRKLLTTGFEHPPIIETMHKRGYKLTIPESVTPFSLWRKAAVYAFYLISGFILLILVIRGINY